MSTLTVMKNRLASELRRDDLTDDIADAISSAIDAYSHELFYFNEFRTTTISTVANQSIYTSSDNADIGRVLKIVYAFLMVGTIPYRMCQKHIADLETWNLWTTFTGEPDEWAWFGQQLHVSPIPSAVYTIRLGAYLKMAAPATDDEASNVWMTDAARLIRCRAKGELYAHVIKKPDAAQEMFAMAEEALAQIKEKSRNMTEVGEGVVSASAYW
jgi:hypothetical protein